MGFHKSFLCENSCDAVQWNNDGNDLIVSFYDRTGDNSLRGSVAIYNLLNEIDANNEDVSILKLNQVIDHGDQGILHICPINEKLIAVADTSGYINLLTRKSGDSHKYKINRTTCGISDSSMCLYMDYNHSSQQMWYSCQNGHIGVTKYNGIDQFETLRIYLDCHQFEAWYVCCFDENVAISGGDDSKVCVFDGRIEKPVQVINKYFTSGVTSIITAHQLNNSTFLIGSFDGSISVWDMRSSLKQPIQLFDNLGGQLWRMKWDNHNSRRLACAMMQSGSAVFELNLLFTHLKVVYCSQPKATQLVYGVDWHPYIENLLASCCHKDKRLEVFNIG